MEGRCRLFVRLRFRKLGVKRDQNLPPAETTTAWEKVALGLGFHSFDGSCFSEYLAQRLVPSIEILPSFRSASKVRFTL